jgi:DNA repair exonuclease SbcCD ATPase subunit
MVIFGWKKAKPQEEKTEEKVEETKIVTPSQVALAPAPSLPAPQAPLFVKLEKYKEIENNLNELKFNLDTLKNSFSLFTEVENVKGKNIQLIQSTLEKIERNVLNLLAEFSKPLGISEEIREETPELIDLSKTLTNLKEQIDNLKAQLEKL